MDLTFSEGDVPDMDGVLCNADTDYNKTPNGRARRTKYRRENSKWITDATYLARPFVAWDGEGVTVDGQHLYVLLANSRGGYISNPKGLGTLEVLHFLESETRKYPGAIHVIYGGSYDFNCWLADLPRASVDALYRTGHRFVGPYRVAWMQGKSFGVSRTADGDSRWSVTINDVVSFFQCAFVKACDTYLGDAFEDRDLIVSNKALRSSFTLADVPEVREYNRMELVNLVKLMEELRLRLNKCNLRPRRWNGPGAIAASLLLREKIHDAQNTSPDEVARASRHAYAGGRFEVIRYGSVTGRAYEYDINSAYPSALRYVPNLAAGKWVHLRMDQRPSDGFALYHVRLSDGPETLPGPLFCRAPNGTICYPPHVTGWYWGPEAALAFEYVDKYSSRQGGCKITCDESWTFVPDDPEDRPFAFIEKLYKQRQALKAAGDGAHTGLKLALNSMYGKLAQQVGWKPATDTQPERLPPFHQLEWAGFTTAYARATVLRAAMTDLAAVIAFETDAVFSMRPLKVPISSDLGAFEKTVFTDLTYVQSGVYFGTSNGAPVVKTRGVDRGTITKEQVITALGEPVDRDRTVTAPLTRFIGAGIALSQSWDKWRTWEVMPKTIQLCTSGKRMHGGCPKCENNGDKRGAPKGFTLGVWHLSYCSKLTELVSCEFPVEWINPDPVMYHLPELRKDGYERDYEYERE